MLCYQHYHIPDGLGFQSLWDFWGRAWCSLEEALPLARGAVEGAPPEPARGNSKTQAALSQLTPPKGTLTHLASYFRVLGYQKGKHSQAPMLFKK